MGCAPVKSVIPQVYRYVVMIDKALQKELDGKGIQGEAQAPYRIIDGGMIHMARMAIFATHSTNGGGENPHGDPQEHGAQRMVPLVSGALQ